MSLVEESGQKKAPQGLLGEEDFGRSLRVFFLCLRNTNNAAFYNSNDVDREKE